MQWMLLFQEVPRLEKHTDDERFRETGSTEKMRRIERLKETWGAEENDGNGRVREITRSEVSRDDERVRERSSTGERSRESMRVCRDVEESRDEERTPPQVKDIENI